MSTEYHELGMSAMIEYMARRLYFNGSMDTVDEAGMRRRLSFDSFSRRNDKSVLMRLERLVPSPEERRERFVTALKKDSGASPSVIVEEGFDDDHNGRMCRVRSLKFTLRREVEAIIEYMAERNLNARDLFLTSSGMPGIMQHRRRIQGGVSDETISLLDRGFQFTKTPSIDPLWERERLSLRRYGLLLTIEQDTLRGHLDSIISTTKINHTRQHHVILRPQEELLFVDCEPQQVHRKQEEPVRTRPSILDAFC